MALALNEISGFDKLCHFFKDRPQFPNFFSLHKLRILHKKICVFHILLRSPLSLRDVLLHVGVDYFSNPESLVGVWLRAPVLLHLDDVYFITHHSTI